MYDAITIGFNRKIIQTSVFRKLYRKAKKKERERREVN